MHELHLMKKSLLLAIAGLSAFTSVMAASPVKAETWWLVVGTYSRGATQVNTIPMESESQCETAGNKLQGSGIKGKLRDAYIDRIRFECIKGK